MSLTKKDVNRFSKSHQSFSKLLLLYPMIHPATMHGLLVEFNYDYGFVMQFILKLESQRNTLYWDEVARASQIMEQENRAKINMTPDLNSTNQRHSQIMAHQMFNSISSNGESNSSYLPINSLMEAPEKQVDDLSFDQNMDSRVLEFMDSQNFSPSDYNNSNLELNHIMPEYEIPDSVLNSRVDEMLENNSSPAPINATMDVEEQQATYSDPNIMGPQSAGILESPASYSYPASNSINWQMNVPEKLPKARPLQTYSNPNIDPRVSGLVRNENNQTVYIHPAHNNDWKVCELMESTKSQMTRFYTNSNRSPGVTENQLSQAHYSYSASNWQNDNTEQALNLQTNTSQLYSNNSNSRYMESQLNQASSSSTSNVNWQNSAIREEAQNLQTTESELHLNNADWRLMDGVKNDVYQTAYYNPAPNNTLQNNEVRETQTSSRTHPQLYNNTYANIIEPMDNQKVERNYVNQTVRKSTFQMSKMKEVVQSQQYINPGVKTAVLVEKPVKRINYGNSAFNNTNWQIIELKDLSNIQTQSQNNSGNGTIYQVREVIEVPVIEATNTHLNSSSTMNTNLKTPMSKSNHPRPSFTNATWQFSNKVKPKIKMALLHSEPLINLKNSENTKEQNNTQSTKAVTKKRPRKQKLKIIKSSLDTNTPESPVCKIMATPIRKPVKRHSQDIDSDLLVKRLRGEEQTIKPNSDPKIRGSNKLRKSNEMVNKSIQPEELSKSKGKQKPRSTPKKTPSKRKEKQEIMKTEPESKNVHSQAHKIKKTNDQLNKKRDSKRQELENKKLETSKGKRNKTKAKANKATRRNNFDIFTSGTDFLSIDPHITKIENIPEGQLITVRPRLNSLNDSDDSSSDVQFIRRFHPNTGLKKTKYSKSKKTDPQTSKKQKKTGAESNKSDSRIGKTTGKPKNKPQSKRQIAISNALTSASKSQNSRVTPKKQKGKSTKGANFSTESRKKDKNPKFPTGQGSSNGRKVPKGSILCCCQSIGFRKKYKLPPFDTDDFDDLYPDEILFPKEEVKPMGDEPFDPERETLFEYFDRNPNGHEEVRKYFAEKNKKKMAPTKTSVKRNYNTRSNKEKKM